MCKDVLIFHVLCSGLPEDHVQNIVLTAKKKLLEWNTIWVHFQLRKLRHREIKQAFPNHTVSKW